MKKITIDNRWGRISFLPKDEQSPFNEWLRGQTRPLIEGVRDREQDAFYWWDYDRWKAGLPIID